LLQHIKLQSTQKILLRTVSALLSKNDDKIIATVMYYNSAFMKEEDTPEWYLKDDVAYFGKFAVHPDYQCKGIGGIMMDFVEDYAKSKGKTELALDTSEKRCIL
jgi:GNAT superfamily N-acetyltransferase